RTLPARCSTIEPDFFSSSLHLDRFLEGKAQRRFCRKLDFFVSGVSSSGRSCAGAGRGPDRRAFTAAENSSQRSSNACSAPNCDGRALPFAFQLLRPELGVDRALLSVDRDRIELELEEGPAFEMSHGLGIHHGTAHGGASLDYWLASN